MHDKSSAMRGLPKQGRVLVPGGGRTSNCAKIIGLGKEITLFASYFKDLPGFLSQNPD